MLRLAASRLGNRCLAVSQLRGLAQTAEDEIQRSAELFAPTKFKPPLEIYGISGLYASACWSAAAKVEKLDEVEREMAEVQQVIDTKPEFLTTLSNPTQLRQKRIQNVEEAFTKAGVSAILRKLFVLMAQNGRLKLAPKVIADYNKIMRAHRKETTVTVTTAKELDKADQKQLLASLKKKIGMERKITMEMVIDPEIIGGLIVEWDDAYRMDLSVAKSIKKLEADLMSAL